VFKGSCDFLALDEKQPKADDQSGECHDVERSFDPAHWERLRQSAASPLKDELEWHNVMMDVAVAVGTLALAFVAAVGLALNLHSTREAYRSRVDFSAQRIVITSCEIGDTRVAPASVGVPQVANPGLVWDVYTHATTPLMLDIPVVLRNEGDVTAMIRVQPHPEIQVHRVYFHRALQVGVISQTGQALAERQGEWWLVPSGETAHIESSWVRSASTWSSAADVHSNDMPRTQMVIEARDGTGNAMDKCTCSFGAFVLLHRETGDGWEFAARDMTGVRRNPPPPRVAEVGLMERVYPREPRGLGHVFG
jgi:hypothetical protein